MIEVKFNIPTIKDFWLWCNNKAKESDNENWKRVNDLKHRILWHISREPIPEENKEYLTNAVVEDFNKLRLKRCIWPVKAKK